ncbi:MAG: PAS domain-containing sensor histidine kinase [Candidatus Eremiobacteraeota bacterium]|nr:PAS domain-containing sensor histidine kinase [Candidatus Eremiobacteraeota bacterium]
MERKPREIERGVDESHTHGSLPVLLGTLFASFHDSVVITDLEGKIQRVSKGTLTSHGFSDEGEILGRSAFDLIHPSEYERARRNLAIALESGLVKDAEYLLVRKDGTTFYGELTASTLCSESGAPAGFVAITKDITARKENEEKLSFFYNAVNAALVGFLVIDRSGTLYYANEYFSNLLGFEKREMAGRDICSFFSEATRELLVTRIGLGTIAGRWHEDLVALEKDGGTIEVATFFSPYIDEEGSVKGYLVTLVDISGERQLRRDLAEKVRDMEIFGHIIAHDFKTPLISIQEFSRLLAEHATNKLCDEEKDMLARIVSGSREALAMIDDLRRYYLIDREEEHYAEVDVKAMLEQISMQIKAEDRFARVRIVPEGELPLMMVRPSAFHHILHNLLENGAKFGASLISVRYDRHRDFHRFTISDDGWGIEPFFIKKVFDIFSRSPKARKESSGTGIGLAIVQRMVKKHGGRITAESIEGKGTTFSLEIPVTPS